MRRTITILLIIMALALVQCDIKETIHAAQDKLNYHKRHMPEKVEDLAEDVQSGFDHAKGAANAGIDALTEDGIRHKVQNAYQAAKDGLKITKDAKDITVDSQKVGLEGAKDSAKEGVHIYRKHEDLKEKVEDAKEFVKAELDESKEAFKDGLHGGLKDKADVVIDTVADGLKGVGEVIKKKIDSRDKSDDKSDGLKKVGDKIKSAVGLSDDKKEESLDDKIKSAVGLGDDKKEEGLGDKIKSAVGLGDADKKEDESLGEKIKAAVGLGDDKHDSKKKSEKKKHVVDQDL